MVTDLVSLELFDKSNILLAKFVKHQTARDWNICSNKKQNKTD